MTLSLEGNKRGGRIHSHAVLITQDIIYCTWVDRVAKTKKTANIFMSSKIVNKCLQCLPILFPTAVSSCYTKTSVPSFLVCTPLKSKCKLSKARQASSYVAECTAHIPWRAMMSSMHKLWVKDNKRRLPVRIVNILRHTLVPQSSAGNVESLNLDLAQVGTTAHTAL